MYQYKDYQHPYRFTTRMKTFLVLIFILIVGVVFTVWRYIWITKSINKGDIKTAALLFTPEITQSVASILYK